MVQSMTGIGECRVKTQGFDINVLIKGVNHRFLNLQVRTPRGYLRFESSLRKILSAKISRGKVDVFVEFFETPPEAANMVLDKGLCQNYFNAAEDLSKFFDIPHGMTAERILRFSDALTSVVTTEMDETLESILHQALNGALEQFMTNRRTEGEVLIRDMKRYLAEIKEMVDEIQNLASEQPSLIKERLTARIQELMDGSSMEADRIDQEIVNYAVKADITEELDRLGVHIQRLEKLFDQSKPVGKEMEFLIQELHRETNTIGSKSVVTKISERIVSVKLNVEKLREQVQNLE